MPFLFKHIPFYFIHIPYIQTYALFVQTDQKLIKWTNNFLRQYYIYVYYNIINDYDIAKTHTNATFLLIYKNNIPTNK